MDFVSEHGDANVDESAEVAIVCQLAALGALPTSEACDNNTIRRRSTRPKPQNQPIAAHRWAGADQDLRGEQPLS
jgi:hypothetical protein